MDPQKSAILPVLPRHSLITVTRAPARTYVPYGIRWQKWQSVVALVAATGAQGTGAGKKQEPPPPKDRLRYSQFLETKVPKVA